MQKTIKHLIAVLLVIAMVASCSSCKIIDTLLFDENPKEPVGGIHFANPDFVEAEDDGSDGDSDPFVGQVSPSSENEENSRFKKVTDYAVLINGTVITPWATAVIQSTPMKIWADITKITTVTAITALVAAQTLRK